jgi:hypothetical protein
MGKKMEGSCSTGQSPQRAVVPVEEEEEEEEVYERTNQLKTAITAYIRNISQADLQKVFANKIKQVQACIDTRRHHFQHIYKCTATFRTHCRMNGTVPVS